MQSFFRETFDPDVRKRSVRRTLVAEALLMASGIQIQGVHLLPEGFSRSPLKTWSSAPVPVSRSWTCGASGPLKIIAWSLKAHPEDMAEPGVFCGLLHEGGHLDAPLNIVGVVRRCRYSTKVKFLRQIHYANDENLLANEEVASRWGRKAAQQVWGTASTEDRMMGRWDRQSDQWMSTPWMDAHVAPRSEAIDVAREVRRELEDEAAKASRGSRSRT